MLTLPDSVGRGAMHILGEAVVVGGIVGGG